jgi:hypothetical protein
MKIALDKQNGMVLKNDTFQYSAYLLVVMNWSGTDNSFYIRDRSRDRSLFMEREVAPKKKGLGKRNFEWVKGWVNEKQNNSSVG